MAKLTPIIRDIIILVAVILLWIVMSIPTTGDEGYIRLGISLIFLIPVIYQIKRIVKKVRVHK